MKRITFPDPRRRETTPYSVLQIVPLTAESIGERRDRRQKENAQDARGLEATQERVPALNLTRLEPEKAHL